MKKSELQTGMRVTLRDGSECLVLIGSVCGDAMIDFDDNSHVLLTSYNEDLTHIELLPDELDRLDITEEESPNHIYDRLDIVKVESPCYITDILYRGHELELLWEEGQDD